jgi:hypothetical protein
MEKLYSEISRLALARSEKTALCLYFTKNPAQREQAVVILPTCEDDDDKVEYLRGLTKPAAGNDFVTRALGT